jgi:YD repeat-containing protein
MDYRETCSGSCPRQTFSHTKGRLTSHTTDLPQGIAENKYEYPDAFTTAITDPDGKARTEEYDDLGRLRAITTAGETNKKETVKTSYEYNAAGEITKITDPSGKALSFAFDLMGRKTSADDPDRGKWTYAYSYDPGLKITATGPGDGQTITSTYDGFNRLKTVEAGKTVCLNGKCTIDSKTSTFTYDMTPNGLGRFSAAVQGEITNKVTGYDEMGRVKIEQKIYQGRASFETRYDYDWAGRLKTIMYPGPEPPDHLIVNYEYIDGTNLVSGIYSEPAINKAYLAQFTSYTPWGQPGIITYGNAVQTVNTYNPKSFRLDSSRTKNAAGPLQDLSYTYSDAGDMEIKTDQSTGDAYSYIYDDLHRLWQEIRTDPRTTIERIYDAAGNIKSVTGLNGTVTYNYADTARPNRLKSVSSGNKRVDYDYDDSGNITSITQGKGKTKIISYGPDGLPESIALGSTKTEFTYDAFGNRAKKKTGDNIILYVSPLYEVEGATTVKYISAGDTKIAMLKGADVHYFHQDHLGSTTMLTDSNGNRIGQAKYTAFGAFPLD